MPHLWCISVCCVRISLCCVLIRAVLVLAGRQQVIVWCCFPLFCLLHPIRVACKTDYPDPHLYFPSMCSYSLVRSYSRCVLVLAGHLQVMPWCVPLLRLIRAACWLVAIYKQSPSFLSSNRRTDAQRQGGSPPSTPAARSAGHWQSYCCGCCCSRE